MYIGQIAAIATAFCWAITSTTFEIAGKKMGVMNLNLLRLLIAFVLLSIFTLVTRGLVLPTDASLSTWMWLLLSGFVGIVIGDLLLFEALIKIGARISMLIYSLSPILTGIFAYILLGEAMDSIEIVGMIVTLTGVFLVLLVGGTRDRKIKLAHPVAGILLALGGAVGQALGYVVGKIGMGDYNAFAATQIRIIAGMISFVILFFIIGQWRSFGRAIKQTDALRPAAIGSFFGPFIGISLSLYAVQRIHPGVASTLMAITPVLLIPYAIFVKKEKVRINEIIGSVVAVTGLAIMFL